MTDLIDRAALLQWFADAVYPSGGAITLFDFDEVSAAIDAAPAISCEECEKAEWMLNEFMRRGHVYRDKRAGYADFYALVKQDLAAAYEMRPLRDDCGDCRYCADQTDHIPGCATPERREP